MGTAVSRGGDSGGGGSVSGGSSSGGGSSYPGGTETIQSTSGGHDRRASGSSGRGNAVSRGDRSRGDRSVIGTAQGRTHPPYGGGGGGGGAWDPGYWWNDPGYAWGYGGLGLGYFYFDPFWGGYGGGDPFGYGVGGGGYSGGYDSFVQHGFLGQLRLKMKPKDAQVYVDGALAGKVGDFDGTFERLDLPEGPHRVEVRLEGHTPLTFDVNIVVDELTTLRGKIQD